MPRVAIQLTPDLLNAVCQMVGVDQDEHILGDHPYMIVKLVDPTEFHIKLVTEDEIVEAAANDCDLEIVSL